MTTKRDLDILIECHDEAVEKRNALAVQIVRWMTYGHEVTARQYREWEIAEMAVQSTARDLEDCMEIAASAASVEG